MTRTIARIVIKLFCGLKYPSRHSGSRDSAIVQKVILCKQFSLARVGHINIPLQIRSTLASVTIQPAGYRPLVSTPNAEEVQAIPRLSAYGFGHSRTWQGIRRQK